MKHLEYFNHWYDELLNVFPFCLDDSKIKTFGIAWIFKENGKWVLMPRKTANDAQFYNAQFFVRLGLPFALFFHMRLSSTRLFQCGLGWKQTGRIALLCRFQTDVSSAVGAHKGLSNLGQAIGWDYGGH